MHVRMRENEPISNLGDFEMPDQKETNNWSKLVITCPHCGAQYVASEIFYPGALEGKPETVIRDALNKVIYQEYDEDEEPCQAEHYICDYCNKPFIVEPNLSFKVRKEEEALDFATQEASLLD